MKFSRNLIISFVLLVLISSLYRIMPGRPWGFAPQIAMALFAGAVVRDRKSAFALPLLSMFISDLLYQALYVSGATVIPGFYEGQWLNYLMLTSLTVIGFFMNARNVWHVAGGSILGPTAYFLMSNFATWAGGGGYQRPKTWEGLMMCYADGLPFYQASIAATLFFGAILFGTHYLLVSRQQLKTA